MVSSDDYLDSKLRGVRSPEFVVDYQRFPLQPSSLRVAGDRPSPIRDRFPFVSATKIIGAFILRSRLLRHPHEAFDVLFQHTGEQRGIIRQTGQQV
jgi:hypothetical protein